MNNNFFYNAYINLFKIEPLSGNKNILIKNLNFQFIGWFDITNHIWYHGWAIFNTNPKYNIKYKKSKELLSYILNIEFDNHSISNSEKIIIKSMISNSKIYISDNNQVDDNIQLDILLAVICYLTKAKKYGYYKANNIYLYCIEI